MRYIRKIRIGLNQVPIELMERLYVVMVALGFFPVAVGLYVLFAKRDLIARLFGVLAAVFAVVYFVLVLRLRDMLGPGF
jgi:hypothetical protein